MPSRLARGFLRTTSGARRMSDILWDASHFTTAGYDPSLACPQAKTAHVLCTVEWKVASQLKPSSVKAQPPRSA
jgi:hypothetical protein